MSRVSEREREREAAATRCTCCCCCLQPNVEHSLLSTECGVLCALSLWAKRNDLKLLPQMGTRRVQIKQKIKDKENHTKSNKRYLPPRQLLRGHWLCGTSGKFLNWVAFDDATMCVCVSVSVSVGGVPWALYMSHVLSLSLYTTGLCSLFILSQAMTSILLISLLFSFRCCNQVFIQTGISFVEFRVAECDYTIVSVVNCRCISLRIFYGNCRVIQCFSDHAKRL